MCIQKGYVKAIRPRGPVLKTLLGDNTKGFGYKTFALTKSGEITSLTLPYTYKKGVWLEAEPFNKEKDGLYNQGFHLFASFIPKNKWLLETTSAYRLIELFKKVFSKRVYVIHKVEYQEATYTGQFDEHFQKVTKAHDPIIVANKIKILEEVYRYDGRKE